ncbi:MAG: hypothetical protein KBS40_04450 [Bacteroidales bacterium]|nr:hypothetical protein [Bacteroidales bacterium]
MNLTCVNEPYAIWAGTVNGWSNVNDENAIKPEVLDGQYAGWFVFEFNDQSETVQGKPLVLDAEGKGSWDYQSGTPDTWVHKGGKEATITVGGQNPAESDLTWPEKGAYIYEITGLKNGANPCTAVYHDYTVRFYVPEFCADQKGDGFDYADSVNVRGSFDNWSDAGVFLTADVDEDGNDFYYLDLKHMPEGTALLIRLGSTGYDDKLNDADLILGATADTTFNYSDKVWKACAAPVEYKYTEYENWQLKHEGSGWEWTENLVKVEEGLFKLADANWTGSGFNVGSDENPIKKDWFAPEELVLGEEVIAPTFVDVYLKVVDDETVVLGLGVVPTALENVTIAPAIRRVMVNGHMYINNNGKLINMLGF